jgi:hypothetical protein
VIEPEPVHVNVPLVVKVLMCPTVEPPEHESEPTAAGLPGPGIIPPCASIDPHSNSHVAKTESNFFIARFASSG